MLFRRPKPITPTLPKIDFCRADTDPSSTVRGGPLRKLAFQHSFSQPLPLNIRCELRVVWLASSRSNLHVEQLECRFERRIS